MLVYYLNMALILGLAYPLCIRKPSNLKKILYLAITFSYMWCVATFRYGFGHDFYVYIDIFNQVNSVPSLPAFFSQYKFYLGHALLSRVMGLFITNTTVMYGVYELFILLPVVWFIYRYCRDAWLSAWLYVTLNFFYISMSFTRQSIAASLSLLGYRFLQEKKPVPYFLVVLAAASFHFSALILIPVYFFAHLRLTPKMGIFYACTVIPTYLFSEQILGIITKFVYSNYGGTTFLKDGLAPTFLIIPSLIFGTCLALRSAWEKRSPEATVLLNATLFALVGWLFITRHFILERLSMYVFLLSIIALPHAVSALRCSSEEREQLAAMKAAAGKAKPSKEQNAKIHALSQKISDHEKYYWCAVAAILIITFLYNESGVGRVNSESFYGVFPYYSIFEWLNSSPTPPVFPT